MGECLVSCYIKKQASVSLSTAEPEYISAGSCLDQLLWIKYQLSDYELSYDKTPIYYDNTSAINLTKNLVQHSRTKHIEMRYHFIREHKEEGTVELILVPSNKQLVDIFTNLFVRKSSQESASSLV